MKILALDLSVTGTGWATNEDGEPHYSGIITHTKPKKGVYQHPMVRLNRIKEEVDRLSYDAKLVVMEGYSYGNNQRAHQLAELGGLIRWHLWYLGIPYVEVAPTTLKKFATGTGKAKKPEVIASAIRRLGYERHDDNEADALWLLQMALHHYGLPGAVPLPQDHHESKAEIGWPNLNGK